MELIVHYPIQQVVIPQKRNSERITEQTVSVPVPQVMEGIVESELWRPHLPSPGGGGRSKSVASARAVAFTAPATVIEDVASSLAVTCAAQAPVTEYVAPSPAVAYGAPAPVSKHVAPTPAVYCAAPAPVIEYVASVFVPAACVNVVSSF